MALKNLIKVFAKKEKRTHRLARRNCTAIMVGLGAEDKRRYEVPNKYLGTILPVLIEDELDPKTDGLIRIYCFTDFFDQILKALKNDINGFDSEIVNGNLKDRIAVDVTAPSN